MDVTPKSAFDYLSRLQDQIDAGRNPVQQMMNNLRDASVHASGTSRRQFIDTTPDPGVFYRKMSGAEWAACMKTGTFSFSAAFKYTDTKNYRLWLSTSLEKVRVFDNENASGSTDVVVKFAFNRSLVDIFTVKAHQETGVQHNASVVAMHREGFPALRIGTSTVPNLGSDAHVGAVKTQNKAYNLGFTSKQAAELNKHLSGVELIG